MRRRLDRYGPNALPPARRTSAAVRLLRQLHHPLIYVLLGSAVVTGLLGEWVDCGVILGVVALNAVVGFIQESQAEGALEGLRSMVRTRARVVRDGREQVVPSDDLVPGDVVVLDAGDKIPADARLTRSARLSIDESALTGESVPVDKDEVVVLPDLTPVADRHNMAYSGTLVIAGSGAGVVVATGTGTELGEIHRLVGAADSLDTPLTVKLASFSKILTVAILALAVVTFAIGLLRGQDPVETFTAAIALAVGAIPEGLPAAVTITLAIGVSRMARRRAVIRRLPAVETLGSTTVICTDKTGTLTQNEMTVTAVWTPAGEYAVTGSGYESAGTVLDAAGHPVDLHEDGGTVAALRWSLLAGAACTDASVHHADGRWGIVGDPTEAAMVVAAAKAGLTADRVGADYPRLATLPFSSELQYMATLHEDTDTHDRVILAKGAAERILDLCHAQLGDDGDLVPLDRAVVHAAAVDLAGRGLRVLATAMGVLDGATDLSGDGLSGRLTFTGLQAMHDPPREAAAAAVRACRSAGVAVKMITGDHAATATAIAHRTGLLDDDNPPSGAVLTGTDLDTIPPDRYADAVDRAHVFARVSPEQKLRLVDALQDRGHVVAMTGDGVNDAPALQQADIGVAMGASGTEVAKDAADMVLTDDDFATIKAAVEEGRGVFDNLTKFIAWTLPTNIGEGLVILVAIAFGTALPILPTQILWINMTTAVALGLMLAFEPKEPGIMTRPPRDPDQPLLTNALIARMLLVSALLVGGSWWLFAWERTDGAGLAEARTAALNLFVVVAVFYLFSCRSLTRSAWRIGLFTNRWIVVGVAVQLLAQLALTYLPTMNAVFGTEPIGADTWLRILVIATLATTVVAVDKRLRRAPARGPKDDRRRDHRPSPRGSGGDGLEVRRGRR
ncbi:cation-transporting ATPase F [Jiangella mangrovi]|uniref:Probable cation-transporting ATPase F n=1 Tax=Jiangella mangrovi TaxID=1524084 RepID=A0A7W9GRM0_9ACTN|nr:cation-transporting ATPase F [Jiangella mangrovi]